MKPSLRFAFVSFMILIALVKAQGDVDPAMVGTWETSGVNAQGPWKLTWEIHADSSYLLSGALSDSGIIESGNGKWQTRSNITKQFADGTYTLRGPNRMEGTGPSGSGIWTRAGDAGATPPESSESNPFADVFPKSSVNPTTLSDEEQAQLIFDKAYASRDKDARSRLEKKAQSGIAMAQELFGEQLDQEENFAEAATWFRKAAEQGDADAMARLGGCYWSGKGVDKSAREAIKWWKQAADKGDEEATKSLNMALEKFDELGQPRTRE
jgi:TPR repeat protein